MEIAHVEIRRLGILPIRVNPDSYSDQLWTRPGSVRSISCLPLPARSEDTRLQVIVSLVSEPAPTHDVSISALSLFRDLGDVPARTVHPSEWQDGHCDLQFMIPSRRLFSNGVAQAHSGWLWSADRNVIGESEHLLFVTIASPTNPWTTTEEPRRATPTAGALMFACRLAKGASDDLLAASNLVRSIRDRETPSAGEPTFNYSPHARDYLGVGLTFPQWFNCNRLLEHAFDATRTQPILLSCTELASIVSIFGNLLGCELSRIKVSGEHCSAINTLPVLALGCPPRTWRFSYHEVAAPNSNDPADPLSIVLDAGLLFDGDGDPENEPHAWELVAGLQIGSTSRPVPGSYLREVFSASDVSRCILKRKEVPRVEGPDDGRTIPTCETRLYEELTATLRSLAHAKIDAHHAFLTRVGLISTDTFDVALNVPRQSDQFKDVVQKRTLFYRPQRAVAVLQVDKWTSPSQEQLTILLALLMADSEVPVTLVPSLGATFISDSKTAIFTLTQGAAVRAIHLCDGTEPSPFEALA